MMNFDVVWTIYGEDPGAVKTGGYDLTKLTHHMAALHIAGKFGEYYPGFTAIGTFR